MKKNEAIRNWFYTFLIVNPLVLSIILGTFSDKNIIERIEILIIDIVIGVMVANAWKSTYEKADEKEKSCNSKIDWTFYG